MPRQNQGDEDGDAAALPPGAVSWDWTHNQQHVACLAEGLREMIAKGPKSDCEVVHRYSLKARIIPMLVHPYLLPSRMISCGLNIPSPEFGERYTDEDHTAYKDLKGVIPRLHSTARNLLRLDLELFTYFCSLVTSPSVIRFELDKAADGGREAHTRTMKTAAGSGLVLEDPLNDLYEPRILSISDKSLRGFRSLTFGRLLCPLQYIALFDSDHEKFEADRDAGRIPITAGRWPALMYPFGHQYNPENEEEGLFQSPLITRACNLLCVGSSATYGGDSTSKNPSTAVKDQITKFTKQILCYVVVQYMRRLLDEDEAWTAETLAWLNREVVDLTRCPKGRGRQNRPEADKDDDPVERIRRQRAARAAVAQPEDQNDQRRRSPAPQAHGRQSTNRAPHRRLPQPEVAHRREGEAEERQHEDRQREDRLREESQREGEAEERQRRERQREERLREEHQREREAGERRREGEAGEHQRKERRAPAEDQSQPPTPRHQQQSTHDHGDDDFYETSGSASKHKHPRYAAEELTRFGSSNSGSRRPTATPPRSGRSNSHARSPHPARVHIPLPKTPPGSSSGGNDASRVTKATAQKAPTRFGDYLNMNPAVKNLFISSCNAEKAGNYLKARDLTREVRIVAAFGSKHPWDVTLAQRQERLWALVPIEDRPVSWDELHSDDDEGEGPFYPVKRTPSPPASPHIQQQPSAQILEARSPFRVHEYDNNTGLSPSSLKRKDRQVSEPPRSKRPILHATPSWGAPPPVPTQASQPAGSSRPVPASARKSKGPPRPPSRVLPPRAGTNRASSVASHS
ncbi:hypothetical protein DFP72DRAFT_860373 [Ephemerocybe angulata]|uniref:Uncharacterized protein n=1 Tax=Ephemerocybe angulata TaxID=980116 RepID=A0A8H6LSV2_9AGAR|nr:hypothetical protein DFP72DRAFT_860373 [Tulosesus angulatus]